MFRPKIKGVNKPGFSITYAAAGVGVDYIVTRNIKDFRRGTIPAMLPEVFCNIILVSDMVM